jgi:hypothetical protein
VGTSLVAQTLSGHRLHAVTYYDIRNNTPAQGQLTDYYVVHSHNDGASWSESRITPTSFDDENAPVAEGRGYFIGD